MRHKNRTEKLGRTTAHRAATLSNVVASVLEHERVTTTLRLAKAARRYTDKMITLAKRDTLHARRQAISFLRPSGPTRAEVVQKLFSELGARYAERPGGYTRIIKLAPRRGDNAPMAILELMDAKVTFKERKRTKKEEEETIDVAIDVEGDIPVASDEKPVEAPAAKKEEKAPAAKKEEEAPAAEKEEQAPEDTGVQEESAPVKVAAEKSADTTDKADGHDDKGLKGFFRKVFHKDDK